MVGTAGATTSGAATAAGATVVPVASGMGFSAGQTVTIDSGANLETAVVATIGRVFGPVGSGSPGGGATISVEAPLTRAHAAGVQVSGSGITLKDAATQNPEFTPDVAGLYKVEVTDVTAYVGEPSPMDFNGMVRHYYLRRGPHNAEIRVNLVDKKARADASRRLEPVLASTGLPGESDGRCGCPGTGV